MEEDKKELTVTAYHKWLYFGTEDFDTSSGKNIQVDYIAHELMSAIFRDNNPQAWALMEHIKGEYGKIDFPDDFYEAARLVIKLVEDGKQ